MSMNEKEFKKIEFYLYNYKNLDKLINDEIEKYVDYSNTSVSAWLKGINRFNNTVENQAIRIANDPKIKEIKKWKAFLKEMLIFLRKNQYEQYVYVKLKYFKEMNDDEMIDKVNLTDLKILRRDVISFIYEKAKEREIL